MRKLFTMLASTRRPCVHPCVWKGPSTCNASSCFRYVIASTSFGGGRGGGEEWESRQSVYLHAF